MAEGQPALARLALERRVTAALAKAKDPAAGAKAAITVILDGEDDEHRAPTGSSSTAAAAGSRRSRSADE